MHVLYKLQSYFYKIKVPSCTYSQIYYTKILTNLPQNYECPDVYTTTDNQIKTHTVYSEKLQSKYLTMCIRVSICLLQITRLTYQ